MYNEQYNEYLSNAESALQSRFEALFSVQTSAVARAAQYSLFAGGKRVRAVLCLAVCDMLRGNMQKAADYAAAIEMVHAYSLIHDDLPCMDNDDMRRGKPSCHKQYGETTALLAGDALLTASFGAAVLHTAECDGAAVALLAEAGGTQGMIYGQELDIANENAVLTKAELEEIDRYKTGAVIRAAVLLGAAAADASREQAEALRVYADKVGVAFQVTDDVLDETADAAMLGKPIGSDKKNGKTTYASLLGLEQAQQYAQRLTHEACESLQRQFGDRASFLCRFAENLYNRTC